jgi:hypothetical protein
MTLLLVAALSSLPAVAGELVVDVKVPARVAVDGEVVADVYQDGVLRVPWADGAHQVTVTVAGSPQRLDVTAAAEPVVLLVGRTGISIGAVANPAAPPVADAVASDVRFRTIGTERLLVQIDAQRVAVSPGKGILLPLQVGDHPISVRSGDGTSVYARGVLTITGGADNVVQVTEGALPETSGAGVHFSAGGL